MGSGDLASGQLNYTTNKATLRSERRSALTNDVTKPTLLEMSYPHHNNFTPNCTCRELVAVEVIIPAVGDGPPVGAAYTTGLGVLKLV
jgi:hypothetical protein